MKKEQIIQLLEKYKSQTLSKEEKAMLESWYIHQATNSEAETNSNDIYENLKRIGKRLPLKHSTTTKTIWPRLSIAATAIIFISFGSYFLWNPKEVVKKNNIAKNDIAPGKNKATLTLANGKRVILNDETNGKLATQAGVSIYKTKNGELVYKVHAATGQTASEFNTLETAKGEQYQIALPDGSRVWLNAASSLKYPTVFSGKERLVELTGEAYFEIAPNKKMPFKVETRQQEVEVLGTHFNINAYSDEKATVTTLLEGSVKVTLATNHNNVVIKPKQQSIVHNSNLNLREVDVDETISWKNGYFQFNDEDLGSIMRKISRWYDVEIMYKDASLQQQVFTGTVSRYKNVSQIIKVLELTNAAHFKIENNKIIVTN